MFKIECLYLKGHLWCRVNYFPFSKGRKESAAAKEQASMLSLNKDCLHLIVKDLDEISLAALSCTHKEFTVGVVAELLQPYTLAFDYMEWIPNTVTFSTVRTTTLVHLGCGA